MSRVTSRMTTCHTCHGDTWANQMVPAELDRHLRHVKGSRRISHAAMRDLKWWASLSTNKHIGRALWPRTDAVLFTDASMSGWGAAWNGTVPASGFFDERQEHSHINELELLAATNALAQFSDYARNRSVEIITDSKVTEFIVRNMTTRSPRILARLRELRALCETHGVTLSTRHIPSVLNAWADRLSRRRDSHAWDLPALATRLLERRFNRRFAVMDGNELPSYLPPHHEPLVLPRPAILPVWARHLQRLGRGVLVAPAWFGQSWFQHAVHHGAVLASTDLDLTTRWPTVTLDFKQQHAIAGPAPATEPPAASSPTLSVRTRPHSW